MIFLLDSGHGGMIDGKYQTDPKIGKFFTHKGYPTFYEGVYNRLIKSYVIRSMNRDGIKYVDICHTEMDLPLNMRITYANQLAMYYGTDQCLLISLHSNAGGGRGMEVFTSPGTTNSDKYATAFLDHFHRFLPQIQIRSDFSDGDIDKEAGFLMVKGSVCPAILPEFLFYDNLMDYQLLMDPAIQVMYAETIVRFCRWCNNPSIN